jgi:hypothetical protein
MRFGMHIHHMCECRVRKCARAIVRLRGCAIVPVLSLLCVSPPTNRDTHTPSLAADPNAGNQLRWPLPGPNLAYPILP